MKTIGFIGSGRITRIFLQAWKNAEINFNQINVYDNNPEVLKSLESRFPYIKSYSKIEKVAKSDIIIIALHPPVLIDALTSIARIIPQESLIISLAPKITLTKIQDQIPRIKNIARMNPTAGTIVNKGYNPITFSHSTTEHAKIEILSIFEKMGDIPVVEEELIEAYAVINAMGYTYFWFQLQELKKLSIQFGLDSKESEKTISAMINGTVSSLFNSGLTFEEVSDLVPVKPLAAHEQQIITAYEENLKAIFSKIKP